MAKSVLEKLIVAIAAAVALRDGAVIGDEEGQYPQANVDSLSSSIEAAQVVVDSESSGPEQHEAALKSVNAAVKMFEASVVKAADSVVNVSLKGVKLKGWEDGVERNHSIHLKSGRIVNFKNGEAELPPDLADELENAGYIE
ncbi:hypothetical protein SD71_16180 [Cohnella kolymensis]|uniref:Uncharacterized protein n=1 Tax=Cohnella kolymensis TaxID=1590652 RepID=A0ABR5A261_9BACL|nr:hypothetical protein [Cohnella kolymensis]KIL35162.1 hypothetical protein SD71_16180 [Cohnella kolymensis]